MTRDGECRASSLSLATRYSPTNKSGYEASLQRVPHTYIPSTHPNWRGLINLRGISQLRVSSKFSGWNRSDDSISSFLSLFFSPGGAAPLLWSWALALARFLLVVISKPARLATLVAALSATIISVQLSANYWMKTEDRLGTMFGRKREGEKSGLSPRERARAAPLNTRRRRRAMIVIGDRPSSSRAAQTRYKLIGPRCVENWQSFYSLSVSGRAQLTWDSFNFSDCHWRVFKKISHSILIV